MQAKHKRVTKDFINIIDKEMTDLDTYLKASLFEQFKSRGPAAVPCGSKLDTLPYKIAGLKNQFLNMMRANFDLKEF